MAKDNVDLYLLIGGRFWRLLDDGTLVEVPPEDVPRDAQVLDGSNTPAGSSSAADSVTPPAINVASFFDTVGRDGDEVLPDSGFQTRQFIDRSSQPGTLGGGLADDTPLPPLDPNAAITVTIDDNGDGYINRYEIPVVDLFGDTIELRDGQFLEVVVTDANGQSITFGTEVSNGTWSLPARDLSALAEGDVTVVVTARDNYGNSVSATDHSVIDTIAEINDDDQYNGGTLLNAEEVLDVDMTGTTSDIGEGRAITVTFSDTSGASVTRETTLDADGAYAIDDVDLSSLADGEITVSLTSTDLPGNIAENVTTLVKDTRAAIDLQFAGDPPYGADEVGAIAVTGTVQDVEAGQTVTVMISDASHTETVTALVGEDGSWTTQTLDVSGWDDGTLTAEADVTDVAGNNASNTTTTVKDTEVSIDIDADVDDGTALDIQALRTLSPVDISGVTDAEAGQTVTLTFADNLGQSQVFITTVQADGTWATTVQVDQLGSLSPWTLNASVTDVAGNTAGDATPTLITPTRAILSEQALDVFPDGYSATSTIRIEQYDEVRFSDSQNSLEGVTAGGVSLSVTVAGDGQSLTASDGTDDVLTAVINGDGSLTVTLLKPVDQTLLTNVTRTGLALEATQNDTDGTSETVVVEARVDIRDAGTFTSDDVYSAVEAEPVSGNVFDNDNQAEGPLTLTSIRVDGSFYTVTRANPAVVSTSKRELTVNADGSWSFTSSRNLDNTVDQTLTFEYDALDQDRDFDTSEVTIDIRDGAPGVVGSGVVTTPEPVYGAGTAQTVDFQVQAGSDDLDPASIAFGEGQLDLLNALSMTSGGVALIYAVSGNTLTASAGGNTVFQMVLSAVDDGGNLRATATLTQSLPLDHIDSDDLSFPLVAVAVDLDGTEATAQSTLVITDGPDPSGSATDAVLNEDDLATTSQATGTVDLTVGSDAIDSLAFTAEQSATLTSGGEPIQFQVSADGLTLTGYTDDPGDPVFQIVLAGDGAGTADASVGYTFDLFRALDQLDAVGSRSDPLTFGLNYRVDDTDGDRTTGQINVSVTDGDPATGTGVNVQLTESPTALANPGATSTATVDFSLTATQDPITTATFDLTDGATVLDDGGNPVTRNGEALTWQQVNAASWEAVDSQGHAVLSLSLPAAIDIGAGSSQTVPLTVTVLANIDHTSADNLTLPVAIGFADSDGTVTSLDADISIYDGRDPYIASIDDLATDEAQTLSGTSSDAGRVGGLVGSDGLVGFNVTLDTAITSQGNAVSLATSATADGWWVASAGGSEVFRLRLGLDGSTEFRLSGPLDHPDGSGENNLPVDFSVTALDGDGDVSNAVTLTVDVTDDIPVAADQSLKLTEGASQSINLLADGRGGADGATLTGITYDGTDYDFATDGDPLVIPLFDAGDVQYGQATIQSSGEVTIQTIPSLNASFADALDFTVTDFDGDQVTNTLDLDIRDEEGVIDISPLQTPEDTALTLTLTANPGDLDDNEAISTITFDLAGLQGGTLTLDGQALATDGSGNPVLSIADGSLVLVDAATGEVQPAGALVFTPALNTSDPTNNFVLDVSMTVEADSGQRVQDARFDLSVTPVVDDPAWDDGSVFDYTMDEDGAAPDLNLQANLFDTDGSEALSYRIENIGDELTLRASGRVIGDGDTLTPAELSALTLSVTEDYAGRQTFDLIAISEETSTGDTAEIQETVTLDVAPVADTPSLQTSNVYSQEDELIPLSDFLSGQLTDTDGSETLSYELTVPADWAVTDADGNPVGGVSDGVFRVSADAVTSGDVYLQPKEDISSINGNFHVSVVAIATESSADGIDPSVEEARSNPRDVTLAIKGVVDTPSVGAGPDGAWAFDEGSLTISGTYNEDELIPLNFEVGTNDDDGSEVFDFVIRDLPDGVTLVDADGNPVDLLISGEYNDQPTYSLTAAQLNNLYVKPPPDYSGDLSFSLQQFNTEPDGDTGGFDLTVDITVAPVVDTDDGLSAQSTGTEDGLIVLNIFPETADIDGSETVTNVILQALPNGAQLFYAGTVLNIPRSGLDLADFADSKGLTLAELNDSGELTVQPPEDAAGTASIAAEFEITDTAPGGETVVRTVSGSLDASVTALVDDDPEDGITRLETTADTLVSTDGSAINLSGAAQFVEEDIDGSEYLDYISITLPEADGWVVSHPNGAINNGDGTWLIPATGLTSASAVDAATELLAGATLISDHTTSGAVDVLIEARVIDTSASDDADIIRNTIQVDFQTGGNTGSAQVVDSLQDSIIDGLEGETVDTGGHLNTGAAGDANDVVSFRIDAADVPYGGAIAGADVIVRYADDGTTPIEYVFTDASLGSLQIVGIDEDFAGATTMTVNKIATDPLGDTVVTQEDLDIEIGPVVDDVASLGTYELLEDTPQRLNIDLDTLLGDRSTDPAEGIETVTELHFIGPVDGSFIDPGGLLTPDGSGGYILSDPSRISDIFFLPPENQHGAIQLDFELTIQDETTGLTLGSLDNPAEETIQSSVTFDVKAITDEAPVTADTVSGDEDSDIALTGLTVTDIDDDGSESLSMQISGVPSGAVLFWDSGSGLVQLSQAGSDGSGGTIWTFTPGQIDGLVLRPPRDFSGDIDLTLTSISAEKSTGEVVTSSADFTVGVDPVADPVAFYQDNDDSVSVSEGDPITIGIHAQTQEAVNPNETLVVTFRIVEPALDGLIGIRSPDGRIGLFQSQGGELVARVVTTAAQLATVQLLTTEHAYGDFDINIEVGAVDSAVVLGDTVTAETADGSTLQDTVSVSITPEPTPPEITLDGDRIIAADSTIPLGITLETINPAPGETSDIVISGLPDGISLNAGSQSGSDWIVDAADIDGLGITNAALGETYSLRIEPRSTLDGEPVSGAVSALDITVAATTGDNSLTGTGGADVIIGGDGNDTLTGDAGADTFLFRTVDAGPAGTPAADTITDFSVSDDAINLSDLATGLDTGAEVDAVVDLTESGGTTTLEVDLGSGDVQTIALDGVSKDDLYGASTSGVSDADILQKMLDDQTLLTGGS